MPSCIWRVSRSPAGSPTHIAAPSATPASNRPGVWPRSRPPPPACGPSSAHRRSASTDTTAATRCSTRSSSRGDGFLADVVADWEAATAPAGDGGAAGGDGPHRDRAGRRRRNAANCCGRCSPRGWAAGWAAASSGCPGSASTICSTSTTAPSTTRGCPVRSTPWRPTRCATASTPTLWPAHCTGPPCCRSPRSARDCCWANRARSNSPRPISGWRPRQLSALGHRFRQPDIARCAGPPVGSRPRSGCAVTI